MSSPDPLSQQLSVEVAAPRLVTGESLAHFCCTHIYDWQCEANPAVCRAFCDGHALDDDEAPDDWPECIVCDSMCEARGDFELNPPDED